MLSGNDIDTWIEMEGSHLPVYEVHEELNRRTCFIASEAGKNFAIHWRPKPGYVRFWGQNEGRRIRLFLDGTMVNPLTTSFTKESNMSTVQISMNERRTFKFAPVVLTDNENHGLLDGAKLQEFSTIRVNVEKVLFVPKVPRHYIRGQVDLGNQPVYERSKKATTHCSTLGDVINAPARKNRRRPIPIPGVPPQDFVFQYASLDWLQAKGFAPRLKSMETAGSSSNVKRERDESPAEVLDAATNDLDLELLDPEDVSALRLMREKVARKKAKMVKPEPLEARSSNIFDGVVIDLTGDDD